MEIVRSIDIMRRSCKALRSRGPSQTLALVPTMGALHDGHLSLVRAAKARCHWVAATIFVNPLQFAPHEDFSQYPRTLDEDCLLLAAEGVDLVFAPTTEEMYPANAHTLVDLPAIGSRLDGASRPGHFRGVATGVAKLLNIVHPDCAFFGQKDAAQVAVLRAMVKDLNFDMELVVCPTVRDSDGLALSSRNRYLSAEERRHALALPRSLAMIARQVAEGQHDANVLRDELHHVLRAEANLRLDYAELVDPESLEPVKEGFDRVLVAIAIWAGKTRLIDNVILERTKLAVAQ